MLVVAIGSFLLLLAVAYMIARPLFAPEAPVEEAEDSKLLVEKDRQLAEIRDLDMDFATGKLTEDDYRTLRARSLAQAAATMRALDEAEAEQLANAPAAEPPAQTLAESNGHEPNEEDDLERAIAARKRDIEEKVR
jgi:hypothetical protein